MKFLVIGSGGREHAIAWKLAQSPMVDKVYCAPGNAGTLFEEKCVNVGVTKIDELIDFVKTEKVDVTFVGPEAPLVDGIADKFKAEWLKIFGPCKAAAMLEGSKAYAKEFMKKYGVKTAEYAVFEDYDKAALYLKSCSYPAVIKADGLAAGKGVVIAKDNEEASKALKDFMINDIFKGSGKKVVIEEFLEGVEASILSITDGKTIIPFVSAKDHKCIFDGDLGPNTGGMGVISPNPYCSSEVLKEFREYILEPTMRGIKEEGMDYTGVIFFGIMITKKGPYLIEYNVRMGDPETQAVLPLMKSDFADLILHAVDGKLDKFDLEWFPGASCCIVAASGGYPGEYKTGIEINGTDDVMGKTFIAGAKYADGLLRTAGGRVLSVVSRGFNLEEARVRAYEDIERISFEGIYYRRDIGATKDHIIPDDME